MAPTNGNAPGGQARGASAETFAPAPRQGDHQRAQRSGMPQVPARKLDENGRRSLPLLIVTRCPYCPSGGPHVHRGGNGPRTAGCCARAYYVVAVPGVGVGRAA